MENPTIVLELENLAWHGTRLQLKDENITKQFGLAIELVYHFGQKQYMVSLYYYDIHHKFFPYSQALITHENVFAPTIKACLEASAQAINKFYAGKYCFQFSMDQSNWIKKAY